MGVYYTKQAVQPLFTEGAVQQTHKGAFVESDFITTKTSNTNIKHTNEPFL